MRHNTMKRVLAATLSLLTVATPMGANVGGILQEVALVAHADVVNAEVVLDFFDTGVTTIQVDENAPVPASFITDGRINIHPGEKIKIVSKFRLLITPSAGEMKVTETGSNGAYTYEFTTPDVGEVDVENKVCYFETANEEGVDNPEVKVYESEEKDENLKDLAGNQFNQGTKFIIVSDTPFKIITTLGDAEDQPVTTGNGVWNSEKNRYELMSYYAETDDNEEGGKITIMSLAHAHQLSYTQPIKNELRATCNAPEHDVTNGIAAGVYGFYTDKITIPAEEEGEDPVELDGDVILKHNGKRTYDENSGVTVVLDRNKDLLGTGGNSTSADNTIEFKYSIKRNGKTIEEVGADGQIRRLDENNNAYGDNGFDRDVYDAETDELIDNDEYINKFDDYDNDLGIGALKLFTATEQGHYDVVITIWGQDNEASAYKLEYSFDIETQKLSPSDFDLYTNESDKIAQIDADSLGAAAAWEEFVANNDVTAQDFAEYYDEEEGIWNVIVDPDALQGPEGAKYYAPGNGVDAFSVTARLSEDAQELFGDLEYGAEDGYQIVSQQIGTDLYTPYSIVVEVYNENYGGSKEDPVTVEIKWQLVEPNALPHLKFFENYKDATQKIDGLDAENEASIREAIDKMVDSFKVDNEKVDYMYLPEAEWDTARELLPLDAFVKGVPTEEGRYRVYLTYDDEIVVNDEVDECIYVEIDKSEFKFDFDDTLQTITYGNAVQLNSYTVLDYLGNEANIAVDETRFTYGVYAVWVDEDGKFHTDEDNIYGYRTATPGLLDVGYYYIDVKGTYDEDKTIGTDGFYVNVVPKEMTASMVYQPSLVKEYDGTTKYIWNVYSDDVNDRLYAVDAFWYIDEDGNEQQATNWVELAAVGGITSAVKTGTYPVQVAKRSVQELPNALDFDLEAIYESYKSDNDEDRQLYNESVVKFRELYNGAKKIAANHFMDCYFINAVRKTADYEEFANLTIADAYTGSGCMYNAEQMAGALGVKTNDTIEDVFAAFLAQTAENYTITNRKFTTNWYVVGDNDGPEFVDFNADVDDAEPCYARLFNDGKIHVAATRDEQTGKAKAFGLIYDKNGKIPAPKNENDLVAQIVAEAALVWDGDYPASGKNLTGAAQTKFTYGANLKPVNVETGIWARPYFVDENDIPHYGDAMYFDLREVTQAELDLRIPGAYAGNDGVTRTQEDEKYTDVIVDNDAIDADYEYIDKQNNKYVVGPYEALKKDGSFDKRKYFIVAVKNTLPAIVDNENPTNSRTKLEPKRFGFVYDKDNRVAAPADPEHITNAEMEAAKADLIVDNNTKCNTHFASAANAYHGENACGANINPTNTMNGVWVRTYVDFGNGLVIYTDPIYFESFNDYYLKEYGVTFDENFDDQGADNAYNTAIRTFTEKGSDKFEFLNKPAVNADYENGKWYDKTDEDRTLTYAAAGIIADKTNSIADPKHDLVIGAANVLQQEADKETIDGYLGAHEGVFGASLLKVSNEVNVRPYIVIDKDLTLYGPVRTVKYDDVKTTPIAKWAKQD